MIPNGNAESPSADKSLDAWFTPGRFAALLGVLIIACFPHVIFGQQTFFYRDYALFGYPLAFHHRESFWHGEMPLWNPFNNCGLPFTAQWNTLTLYPPSLFYLLLPLPWSLGVFCLGHLFLAGLGMYFLARRWTGSNLAAAAAGAAFAFNGLTWHSLMWPNNISALGWMPWVVLAVERAWREGGRRIIVAGLAGALQMLAGAPEIIILTWCLLGVLWLVELFAREISPGKMICRALAIGTLVGGLAAAQLLPFLDLLAHSQRDTTFGDSQWAMPATGWANYLVALFRSTAASHGVYMQHDQYWTSSYFLGVGALALALFAVWRARSRRVWTLAALALFSLTMSLGDNSFVYPALRKIAPQIGFMRFPIKFVVLATFVLPLLAAHGLRRLRSVAAADWPREWKRLRWLGFVLVGLMIVLLGVARTHPLFSEDPAFTDRLDDLNATLFSGLRGAAFLGLIFGCLALMQSRRQPGKQAIFQTALIVLLWFDVFTHVSRPAKMGTLSPTVSPEVYEPGLMRQYFNKSQSNWDATLEPGQSRLMLTIASLQKMYWSAVEDPVQDVYGRRITFYDDVNLLDRIPKIDGFYSLYLREMNDVVSQVYQTTNEYPRLRDFLGISHVNPATNAMEWVIRSTTLPLVTGGQRPVFVDDATALRMLFDPAFDSRERIYLPLGAKSTVRATNRVNVKISSNEFSAQRISFHTDAVAPAVISIAQAYYHPWRAAVDGQAVSLYRANHAFQALEVPAGQHQVELVYRDNRFRAGACVSLVTLLGCAAVWFFLRRRALPASP